MVTRQVDAVVVGLGAMGAAAAWQLAGSGRTVVGLEQFEPGHDRGSSHGATRIFRLAYRDPRYVALALAALPRWRELEKATGEVLLEQVGQLDHGDAVAIDEICAHLDAAGRPYERLDPRDASERWPAMRFGEAVVFSPDGGRCWAERTVAAAARAATDLGAELHYSTPVRSIAVEGDTAVVRTDELTLRAPVAVVSAGAWVAPLLAGTVRLPSLEVVAEQPSHFRPREAGGDWPSFLHHSPEAAGTAGLGFAAYGLETPGTGIKVGGAGTAAPVDPDRRGPLDPVRTAALVAYVEEWFPGLDPEPVDTTSCLFTSTSDEHFVLDRRGPVIVCSPCSGHGFKFVPAIGRAVRDLADGGPTDPAWRLPA